MSVRLRFINLILSTVGNPPVDELPDLYQNDFRRRLVGIAKYPRFTTIIVMFSNEGHHNLPLHHDSHLHQPSRLGTADTH
jgi:hypothetical protein